jgi:hypothetical protein
MTFLFPMLVLIGCDAERLGVAVPRGGPEMIEPSQIKRDLWKMTDPRIGGRVPGSSGSRVVARYLAERMEAAGLAPGFGDTYRKDLGSRVGEMICGVHRGSGDQAVLVATLDPGIGTLSALPAAGLLSLAGTFEMPQAPMHSLYFCSIPEAGGLTGFPGRSPVPVSAMLDVFMVGTLTGPQLLDEAGPKVGHVQSRLLHSGPLSEHTSDQLGELDYRTIGDRVADIYSVGSAVD